MGIMIITNLTHWKAEYYYISALCQDYCPIFTWENQGRKKDHEMQNFIFMKWNSNFMDEESKPVRNKSFERILIYYSNIPNYCVKLP